LKKEENEVSFISKELDLLSVPYCNTATLRNISYLVLALSSTSHSRVGCFGMSINLPKLRMTKEEGKFFEKLLLKADFETKNDVMKRLYLFVLLLFIGIHSKSQEPVAHYRFSNNTFDSSINQYDGTNYGAGFCEDQNQIQNEAACFNGNEYVFIGDNLNFGVGDFSTSIWIYVDEFVGDIGGNLGGKILNKGLTSKGIPMLAGYGLRALNEDNLNKIRFEIAGSQGEINRIDYTNAQINTWYNIIFIRESSKISMFVNCELVGLIDLGEVLNVDTDIPFVFGCIHRGEGNSISTFFKGKIDECKVYDYALNQDQIEDNCSSISTSVDDWKEVNLVSVFPNPVQSYLIIEGFIPSNQKFRILNLEGEIILESSLVEQKISVENFSSGIYLLEIIDQKRKEYYRTKFIVF
jgi:hypothetical protein